MHKRYLLAASAIAVLAGCGGGGGSSISSTIPGPAPSLEPLGSARFTVDSVTGAVSIEPISGTRAAFGGNALSFTSSMLLSEGAPERRLLRVTARNNTQETIGVNGQFRVIFSSFQNTNTPLTDLRSTIKGETVWGTGAATTTLGAQSTATIASPVAVDYDPASGTIYSADLASGTALKAAGGTVSMISSLAGSVEGSAFGPGFLIGASNTALKISINEGPANPLVGGAVGSVDGDFAAALFTDINDIYMVQANSSTNFELLVADDTKVRRVLINPSNPNGLVTTVASSSQIIRGITQRNGVMYISAGSSIQMRSSSGNGQIGLLSTPGFVDGNPSVARFSNPGPLRFVGGNLFVADTGNNRIRQLSLRPGGIPTNDSSWWVSTLSGSSTAASVDGQGTFVTHNSPVGLSAGPGESIYVADQGGNRIRRISALHGSFASNIGDGSPNPTELARLSNPTDYVPSNPIRNPFITEMGEIAPGDDAALTDWQFTLPEGLRSFSFIVTVEAEIEVPGVLPSVANTGSGTKGSPNVNVRAFTGGELIGYADGSTSTALFSNITGLASTKDGVIFVADSFNNSIRRIDRNNKVTTIVGSTPGPGNTVDGDYSVAQLKFPASVDCSPDGSRVYFTQGDGVVRVAVYNFFGDPALRTSWTVYTIAGAPSSYGTTTDTNGSLARFGNVSDVVYVSADTLYVLDRGNNHIRRITKTGPSFSAGDHYVQTIAGDPNGAFGYADGITASARFDEPDKAVLLPNKILAVSDLRNRRIRLVTLDGRVSTLSGSGLSGFQDSTSPLGARFGQPTGLAADPSGYLYIQDRSSYQIRRAAPSGVVTTVAGSGGVFGSLDGTGNNALFSQNMIDCCVGPGGDLYVADGSRIRLVQRVISN